MGAESHLTGESPDTVRDELFQLHSGLFQLLIGPRINLAPPVGWEWFPLPNAV